MQASGALEHPVAAGADPVPQGLLLNSLANREGCPRSCAWLSRPMANVYPVILSMITLVLHSLRLLAPAAALSATTPYSNV